MTDRRTVLIIEDEEKQRIDLEALLGHHGFETEAVGSAEEGSAFLSEGRRVDAILLDQRLPGESGLDFFREKLRRSWPDTPVIVLTAYPDGPEGFEFGREGAFRFLVKSSIQDPAAIPAAITEAVEEADAKRQQRTSRALAFLSLLSMSTLIRRHVNRYLFRAERVLDTESEDDESSGIFEALEIARRAGQDISALLDRVEELNAQYLFRGSSVLFEAKVERNLEAILTDIKPILAKAFPGPDCIATRNGDTVIRIDELYGPQILLNVLHVSLDRVRNANGRSVTCAATVDKLDGREGVRITVSDDSDPLTSEQREMAFDWVDRKLDPHSDMTLESEQFASQMTLVRHLTRAHEGEVWLSEPRERGLEVNLFLPT